MPKANEPLIKPEKQDFRKLKGTEKRALRVGLFYSKFNSHQRHRFDNTISIIEKVFGFTRRTNPLETILIRQIALNVVLADKNALWLLEIDEPEYQDKVKKILWQSQKEIRETVSLLHSISHVKRKKKAVDIFSELREGLRKEEGLEKSTEKDYHKDGHGRRYHKDGVTRTKKAHVEKMDS